jgi:hypothetical protein
MRSPDARTDIRRAAIAAYAIALVVFGAFAIPFVTHKRDQPAAVPDPPPLKRVALDAVPPGASICMSDIAIEQHSQEARFQVGTFGKRGPPLDVVVTGAGYRAGAHARGGYADNAVQSLPIRPPSTDQLVRVCVRNGGSDKIALYAANDSARSRARVDVDGKQLRATPALAFYEASDRSIAERMPASVERMSTFRGPLGHEWLIWLVLIAFVVVLPLGIGAALWRDWR